MYRVMKVLKQYPIDNIAYIRFVSGNEIIHSIAGTIAQINNVLSSIDVKYLEKCYGVKLTNVTLIHNKEHITIEL